VRTLDWKSKRPSSILGGPTTIF